MFLFVMIVIISIIAIGVALGFLFRSTRLFAKIEKSISLTIPVLLFVMGVTVGSNRLVIENFWSFGWQALLIAGLAIVGSLLASYVVFRLFFEEKGGE